MRIGRIFREEAWLAINTTIWRTLSYPLAALRISKDQWEAITAPILRYGLPAMGICRNFSRQLTFSDTSLLGLGFKHLFTMQEITRIKDLIQHTWEQTLTGKLYRTSFELFFIEIGIGPNLLDIPEKVLFLASESLVTSTVHFLREHQITLKHDIILRPQRQCDLLIMEAISHLQISQSELFDCNCCCLYLKALFLSDIVTGDGCKISEDAWSGACDDSFRASSWPRWPKPSRSKWKVWQQCILKAFCVRGRQLRQPLGLWVFEDPEWPWFVVSDYRALYQRRNQQWFIHPLVALRKKLTAYESTGIPCEPPAEGLYCTSVQSSKSKLLCTGYSATRQQSPNPQLLLDYLQDTPANWCTQFLSSIHNGASIAQAIVEGSAIAVSDGSYKDGYGTASWTIQDESGQSVDGNLVCPGLTLDMSSFRSELAGLYSIALITLHICKFFHIQEGAITVGCNGRSALTQIFQSNIDVDAPCHDLVLATRHLIKSSAITWKPFHVKGHQDSTGAVLVQGEKITSKLSKRLYATVHTSDGKSYWLTKSDVTLESFALVDWEAIGCAMKEVKRSRRVFVSKHCSGMCGVGKFMLRWKEWEHDLCPRCGISEDSVHVWTCAGFGANELWDLPMIQLTQWVKTVDTHPDIVEAISGYLSSWRSSSPFTYDVPPGISLPLLDQQVVGGRRTFEGWIVKGWTEIQQQHYRLLHSRRSGQRWTIELIKRLWNIAWDLWQHRNNVLHEKEHATSASDLRKLNRDVTSFFSALSQLPLPHNSSDIIATPLSTLLRRPIHYKREWLRQAQLIRSSARYQTWRRSTRESRDLKGMQDIRRSWLQRQ